VLQGLVTLSVFWKEKKGKASCFKFQEILTPLDITNPFLFASQYKVLCCCFLTFEVGDSTPKTFKHSYLRTNQIWNIPLFGIVRSLTSKNLTVDTISFLEMWLHVFVYAWAVLQGLGIYCHGCDCKQWRLCIHWSSLNLDTQGRFTPRGHANSPWGRLHEISAFFGLEAGLNYTL